MTGVVQTGKHRPARADIPRAGITSGTDTLLPPACAIATCHHKDHQLTRTKLVEEPTEIIYSRGWAAPSYYVHNMANGRTHTGVLTAYRKWWQFWKPKSVSWEDDIPCFEPGCDLEHRYAYTPETLLDIPELHVTRDGIRFPTNEERA